MKATSTLLAGIIILAMGLILIICHDTITGAGIVTVGGIIFVISAIVDIVLYIGGKDKEGQRRKRGAALVFGWIVSVAALLLGISMFVFNDTFTRLIAPMFGILVLLGALVQLWVLAYGTRPVRMPAWLYAVPGLMCLAAILVFVCDFGEPTVNILTGSALTVFGLGGFLESALLGMGRRHLRQQEEEESRNRKVIEIEAKDAGGDQNG